jgi:D-alanyl-D-alanine carboxypeptidase
LNATRKIRPTRFERKIAALQKQLGIPRNYGIQRKLDLCEECTNLVSIGKDIFDRDQKMTPRAAHAWFEMKAAAASSGIELQAVSAFRSVAYQAGIIEKKLAAGHSMEQILGVSTAPGYSEHHTGRALDISTPGYKPLEEEFEQSPAFKWLEKTAGDFGFRMSFPKKNHHGVCYEPWHWCWAPGAPDTGQDS